MRAAGLTDDNTVAVDDHLAMLDVNGLVRPDPTSCAASLRSRAPR
jgi:hypothetical protein